MNSKLQAIGSVAMVIFGLCGCTKYVDTSTLQEPAVVVATYFCASHDETTELPDGDGNLSIDVQHIAADFGVGFQCQHGQFVITGSDATHADLWKRLSKGDKVTVFYRERYAIDSKGNRKFHDFIFENASKDLEK
jgi:hypothetical protein